MERVPFSGSAVLKGVRTCADPRKLQLGQAHIVCTGFRLGGHHSLETRTAFGLFAAALRGCHVLHRLGAALSAG